MPKNDPKFSQIKNSKQGLPISQNLETSNSEILISKTPNLVFISKLFCQLNNKLTRIINPARIFLILLIILVLLNCFLSLQTRNNSNKVEKVISVRILASSMDSFGAFEYTVWHEGSIWNASFAPRVLAVGSEVKIKAKMESLVWDNSNKKFANYDLSLGINGNIKILEVLSAKCDLECRFWQQLSWNKINLQNFYRGTICDTFGRINQFLSGNQCHNVFGLTNGLILGGSDKFDKEMRQNFRTLGLSHLVAVSGFQVVLLVSFLELILNRLRISRIWKLAWSFLAIIFLVLIVGPQPPVLRSGISLILAQSVLLILGKKISSLRCLLFSALILLIINPFYLISVSFQLSFLASFGLVLGFQKETLGNLFVSAKESKNLENNLSNQELTKIVETNSKQNSNLESQANIAKNCRPNQKLETCTFLESQESDKHKNQNWQNGSKVQSSNSTNLIAANIQMTNLQNEKLEKESIKQNETQGNFQALPNTKEILKISKNKIKNNTPNLKSNFELSFFSKIFDFVGELFWATFNSFIFTLPIIINLAGAVSPISILTNLLVVPIIPILTIFNLLGIVPFLGIFPIFVASLLQSLLILLISDLAKLGIIWQISAFSSFELILYYATLILIYTFVKKIKQNRTSQI